MNAVFQKRPANTAMYHSFGYYDQHNDSDTQGDFPSLRKKVPRRYAFPPSKGRPFHRRGIKGGVKYNREDEEREEDDTYQLGTRGEASITSHACYSATFRSFASPGRLLSGQLKSSSVHPIHPDNLQDVVIGIQKSPYERLMPKLNASSRARKSASANKVRPQSLESGSISEVCESDMSKPSSAADETNKTEEGLTLNKLDITHESSDVEELISEATVITCPQLELKPMSATSESPKIGSQEKLYKPKNVAITFTRPRKLFRLTSTHARLLQRNISEPKQHQESKVKSKEPQFTAQRGEYYSSQDAKHRLVLNKEEGTRAQGVFGVQNHPAMKCVLRSQERRKLKLESKSLEKKDAVMNKKKIQVYLIKSRRSFENILPELSEKYCFESGKPVIDLYDE